MVLQRTSSANFPHRHIGEAFQCRCKSCFIAGICVVLHPYSFFSCPSLLVDLPWPTCPAPLGLGLCT